jgi:hypothetical protein
MIKAYRIILLLIYFLNSDVLNAQNLSNGIYLNGATIYPEPNAAKWTDSILKQGLSGPAQVIIQFSKIPTQEERYTFKNSGITLLDYLPDNSFIAIIPSSNDIELLSKGSVRSIINMQPEWKANSYLWTKVGKIGQSPVKVIISFYPDIDKTTARKFLEQSNCQITEDNGIEQFNAFKITVSADKIKAIAKWYGVKYINPVSEDVPLDYRSKGMEKANIAALPFVAGGYGLLGDGVTVGVGDNASAIYHVDTKDRVINYNPAPDAHHGVHINGIVGGAGIIDPNAEGVAPHVTLVDHFYENVVFQSGVMLHDHNMNVTNNSYALTEGDCNYDGVYDFYSNATDAIMMQYPTVGHVFAAGNDGNLNCTPMPQGFGTVIGGYQTAKNSIVVTSTDKMYVDANDGSRGPTRDRRIKPELTANGVDVFSLIGIDVYEVAGGTSMASPQVAGAYALLTERYRQLFGSGVNPRSDLIKTILMNGATDIGNPGPDYRYGFGFLNINRSLQILNNNRYTTNTISNGGAQTTTINIPPNTAQLKVMLYWHDTAASPVSAHQLVNDLDLTVIDASLTLHHPLVPDTDIANINNNATEKADHINNCEQIIINNPTTGLCAISVSGYNVPSLSQNYVIAYDFIPVGIQVTYPFKQDVIKANDSFQVYWEASPDPHGFTLEYSTNNGGSWTTIDNNIPANQLFYTWRVPNISSNQCMLRLTRNSTSQQSVSGSFVINPEPIVQLDSIQCPGYININWGAVPNATAYQVLRKTGPYMQAVDTVTSTSYLFKSLSLDSIYYVAIRPLINGTPGFRSLAIRYQPNTGNCKGSISDGDLMMQKIIAPNNGRKFTSTQLGSSENLVVQLRNLDDAPCNSYTISYKVNSGSWISNNFTKKIPANGVVTDTVAGLDLSNTGSYSIQVSVDNLSKTDPVKTNDTAKELVLQLDNQPIDLSTKFIDDFETMPLIDVRHDTTGVSPNQHWDFSTVSDTIGRMRSFVNDSIVISGNRSISMDNWQWAEVTPNYFTGTFNLTNYNADSDEVRMQFDYILHGVPVYLPGNQVWVRSADDQAAQNLYVIDTNSVGKVVHSGSLSISDVITYGHQSFTPSTQIIFGQSDGTMIGGRSFGSGLTIDNFQLYLVKNDVQLTNLVSPNNIIECSTGSDLPVVVKVYNGVRQTQTNVKMFYQFDGGVVVQDTLPSIAGKDTVVFSFKKQITAPGIGVHNLSVWLSATGDTYTANDSIMNHVFHEQSIITSFPYLENFEKDNGGYFADGNNSSWQYGTPASQQIHKAASGMKAWKTNLTGHYNDYEQSYLYSPCFDVSALSKPMLSFSFAMDLENCGNTLCDEAYIEYSTDGNHWSKLGAFGQGVNWYDSLFDVWNEHGNTRWHVASIPLPKLTGPLRIRFVLRSDPAMNYDGIAIDDVHIFDLKYPAYGGSATNAITQNISGNNWIDYLQSSEVLTEMNGQGQIVNDLSVTQFKHDQIVNPGNTQYYFPRSYTVEAGTALSDSVVVRLFIPDNDVVTMLADTTCSSCTKAEDAYSLGITKYDDPDKTYENGFLEDNNNGVYSYYPYSMIRWVPYDNGYYAEMKLRSFSELWFNDGGPTHDFPVGIDYLVFNARRKDITHVKTDWTSLIDTAVNTYEVQRGNDAVNFSTIGTVNANHAVSASYVTLDSPSVILNNVVWYRLKYTLKNGKVYYSVTRRVDWTDQNQLRAVYPNPNTDGIIHIQWTAIAGTQMKTEITDVMGKVVYNNSITATEWNNYTTIQTPRLPSGLYFMRTEIGPNNFINKLVYR